ncbi:ABC transporter substrate-binding protein [Lyngbya confervoides]|uniref:ABC transporter substrate-binding protein n=1 Tax=Lyngbya confervoides BDU141951 TaxID=1574623 RepID=A0ABD4T164_9CYAN|nr:ABC transporter substrate-binding protein [Lyngbya confervoides]MCM1982368.1 ABC transporter substrate-binding protein [Lyngbya confervoides BDU141951]
MEFGHGGWGRWAWLLSIGFMLGSCQGRSADLSSSSSPVQIFGSLTGEGGDIVKQAIAPFSQTTGIEVIYEGSDAFATVLPIKVEAGNKPDIAIFPQPGLMANLAQEGDLVPLEFLDQGQLAQAYGNDWVKLGTVEGKLYGIWMRADPKSIVWYNPKAFQARGYQIPETWSDLQALTQKIQAAGAVPWCLGMESGDATGWVGTDWVESILLRTAGPQVYDQWVNRQIPFTAPAVKMAFERFGAIARDPRQVVGGTTGVVSIPFGDSPAPLFDNPPGCYLHRQASFIIDFLPNKVNLETDVNVFELPSINPQWGKPLLVGGLVFSLLNDRPEARAMMEYLISAQPHRILAGQNYITPHQGVPLSAYGNPLMRRQAQILRQAESIRFDGSDLMPAQVGTGTFWTGMVDYVGGEDLDTVLQTIDRSWPNP